MIEIEADVLIVGGSMAAGWAAVTAAKTGASVVVVDKGFMGTSGVTAPAGPNHWWVPPNAALRQAAVRRRLETAFGLADPQWMERIIGVTWRSIPELDPYYPFSGDGRGGVFRSGLLGPEYRRALRRYATDLGVRDHHPVLELLARPDGSIGGAAGYDRLGGDAGDAGGNPGPGSGPVAPCGPAGGGSAPAGRCWREVSDHLHGAPGEAVAARETAAMVATARWCNAAALD